MEIKICNSEFGKVIILDEKEQKMIISFGGNDDLYWTFSSSKEPEMIEKCEIKITKENYMLYSLFQKLLDDIKNINIFDGDVELDTETKEKYILYNYSNYQELYSSDDNTVTWYSDETNHEVANYLTITEERDSFIVRFFRQPYIEGFLEDFGYEACIPVRFRNSGSRYYPFNVIFMKMYNNMQCLDNSDVTLLENGKHLSRKLERN